MKVKNFIEMLKPCAPDAELRSVKIYRTADGEAIDVVYKTAETIEIEELEDQITSLKAFLSAEEKKHKIKIDKLKEKALKSFLECDGYDEFEREIDSI